MKGNSSDSLAIRAEGVSKKYRLFRTPHDRLKEALHPFRKTYHTDFWALRDVSFEVPKGQTLGILGRNGSGKSTLLQIVSDILLPTEGRVDVNGRLSALLELGAGFNPEFTGRDNAVFSGILAGRDEEEMRQRMPDIEAFADIGEFIDQPVRTYSSGMFARLAFATAINVDPDILIIDEILAVGDLLFQEKCFRKIRAFKEGGGTILLVGHNPRSLASISDDIMVLDRGRVCFNGPTREAINFYYELMTENSKGIDAARSTMGKAGASSKAAGKTGMKKEIKNFIESKSTNDNCPSRRSYNKNEHRIGNGDAFLIDYLIVSESEIDPIEITSGENLEIYIKFIFNKDVSSPQYGMGFNSVEGILIYGTNTEMLNTTVKGANEGDIVVFCFECKVNILEGSIFLNLGCSNSDEEIARMDARRSIARLTVRPTPEATGYVNLKSSFNQL